MTCLEQRNPRIPKLWYQMLCNQLQREKKRDIHALEMSHFEGATSNTLHEWTILGW